MNMRNEIFKNDLVFIPLGGSGEIGMNCNLYHYNNSWIMIDLGVMFGNSNLSSNELIMPNIDFLTNNDIKLDGLILLMHMKIILVLFLFLMKNLVVLKFIQHHLPPPY